MTKTIVRDLISAEGIQVIKKSLYLLVGVPLTLTGYASQKRRHICKHCQGHSCPFFKQLGELLAPSN